MYDNLLAHVPTDLWIGGKWRKASDNARFDVIDPATENVITSVASASIEDAKAAVEPAAVGHRIQMTAQDEDPVGLTAQCRPRVPSGIHVVLHRQLRQLALKPCSSLEPRFTPRDSLRSMIIRGQRPKLLEI